MMAGKEYPARVELLGVSSLADADAYAEAVSTAAFTVINDLKFVAPGSIIPDALAGRVKRSPMKHLRCSNPYLWESQLETTDFDGSVVAWILLVPIGDDEARYSNAFGPDALARLLEDASIDVANLRRASVVPKGRGDASQPSRRKR